MPYAKNELDGRTIYFEDDGGHGTPVVVHGGILYSIELVRQSAIVQELPSEEFRPIFVDHRGVGRSEKPHDPEAYAMPIRVADAVAPLDELAIDRAHFVGTSWGGRLGFGIGEHAPERVLSLVIGGQQPYAIDPDGPLVSVVTESLTSSRNEKSMAPFVESLQSFWEIELPDPLRDEFLDNDPVAIESAWRAALTEGAVSENLEEWQVPCLIFIGARDQDFLAQAQQAAKEIPNAEFMSMVEADHHDAHTHQQGDVIDAVLHMMREHS